MRADEQVGGDGRIAMRRKAREFTMEEVKEHVGPLSTNHIPRVSWSSPKRKHGGSSRKKVWPTHHRTVAKFEAIHTHRQVSATNNLSLADIKFTGTSLHPGSDISSCSDSSPRFSPVDPISLRGCVIVADREISKFRQQHTFQSLNTILICFDFTASQNGQENYQ